MICEGSFQNIAEDEPVFLTVRNTFVQLQEPGLLPSLRTRSEPNSFKPEESRASNWATDEASSQASTQASGEEESPEADSCRTPGASSDDPGVTPCSSSDRLLLPAAILRGEAGSPDTPVMVRSAGESEDDASCRSPVRKITFVPTPSTLGRRTPDSFYSSPPKKVFFSEGCNDELEETTSSASCLTKQSTASQSVPECLLAAAGRRVSFARADEVVHIPVSVAPTPATAAAGAFELGTPYWGMAVAPPAVVDEALCSSLNPMAKPWVPPQLSLTPMGAQNVGSSTASKPKHAAQDAWGRFSEIVESVRVGLSVGSPLVACVEAKEGARGWTVTAYVQPHALKLCRDQLIATAQQALLAACDRSDKVFLLGYGASPFTLMPLGFGAAIADMPDKTTACWASFSKGFCDKLGVCDKEHPQCQVGVNVMLKPARHRA